jgi:hypothetical protein
VFDGLTKEQRKKIAGKIAQIKKAQESVNKLLGIGRKL